MSLVIDDISMAYGSTPVLRHISATIGDGEFLSILGHSGCGKTTLLKILAGFITPTAGQIFFGGDLYSDAGRSVPPEQRDMGMVFQSFALWPHMTVRQHVEFPLQCRHGKDMGRKDRQQAVDDALEMTGLADLAGRYPDELSGGQRQRVSLARAIAAKPALLLMDEPLSALDADLRISMRREIRRIHRLTGTTVIFVTHDQAEALSFADQVAVMRAGTLVQVGSPQALYHHPRDADTARFLGDCIVLDAELRQGQARCALGTIPVADTQRAGAAQIMLRPEQLELGPQDGAGVRAEVVDTDFGGASCTVRVQLAERNVAPMEVRSPSLALPAVGSMVSVQVRGEAHVFA